MWKFDKIYFKNLFSYDELDYCFKNNTCTLIVGENKDNGGNNGAGKSTIFEAITIALTGKSLRDLRKENFINRDSENCFVKLQLTNDVLKEELCITRQFFRGGKSAKVIIEENGEVNTNITSVNEADKRIYELIGISRDDLLRYFIISQDSNYTFFTAGDVEKKEVLNRITSANMINPLLDKLSCDKKGKDQERSEINNELVSIDAKKTTLEEQISELESNCNSEELSILEEKIKKYEKSIKDKNIEIEEIKSALSDVKNSLKKIIVVDTSILENERKKIRKEVDKLEEAISENERIERVAKGDLDGKIKCPACGNEFIKNSRLNLSVQETEEVIKSVAAENKKYVIKQNKLKTQLNDVNKKLEDAERNEEQKQKKERLIKKLNNNIQSTQDDIISYKNKIVKLKNEIKELKENNRNIDLINSLKKKIQDCKNKFNELSKKLTKIDDELDMINYWSYYLGKAGFMTYLANRAVSVLEGTVNNYLKCFKSSLSVNINGFKILKDGSVREKIEVFALEDGLNAEAFMSKSGGERGRINLAGVLAIQHLINMSTEGRGLNFIGLDETFAGIDAEGQENIIHILENLGITVLMITQNVSSEFNNDNKLVIRKENGISCVVQ